MRLEVGINQAVIVHRPFHKTSKTSFLLCFSNGSNFTNVITSGKHKTCSLFLNPLILQTQNTNFIK